MKRFEMMKNNCQEQIYAISKPLLIKGSYTKFKITKLAKLYHVKNT